MVSGSDPDLSTSKESLKIVVTYGIFAGLWILFSDPLLGLFVTDHDLFVQASIVKGWAFVAVTALLLYGLVSRLVSNIDAAHRRKLDSERERHEAIQLLSAVSGASSDAIYAKDTEGRYLICNPAACRFVGKSADEIIGRDDHSAFPPEQAEMLLDINRHIVAEGQQTTAEEELDTPEGRRTFLATKGPLRDENGRIFGTFGISRDITRRKQAERALRESQERLRLFVEHAPAALAMFDRDMRYIAVSRRWMENFKLGERDIVGLSHYEVFPDLPEKLKTAHRRGLAGEVIRADEDRFERADGTVHWLRWEMRPWHGADGDVAGILIFSEDISDRKLIESELRISATAFESQLGMIITDHEERILRVNQAFTDISGFDASEAIGKTPRFLKSGQHDADFYREMWEALRSRNFWQGEIWNRHRSGDTVPVLMSISAVLDDAGQVTHYIGAFSDISRHKRAEEVIHSLSFYDSLTALPNRRLMVERLKEALQADRRGGYGAVLFIDLDDFSSLNDTRGHEIGDIALAEVAARLRACVPGHDNVARPNSDEFAVILEGLGADADQAAARASDTAERIQAAIRPPMALAGEDYRCTASIGISLFRTGATTVDELMRQSDASMYQVKRLGRDRIHFFDPEMQGALEMRVMLEAALRRAIPDELRLHFQPQVDDDGKLLGAECLLRWQSPENGLIAPGEFIALAEETGLILPIGRWVLETACHQLKRWEANPATRNLLLAVNVSALQFHQPDFVAEVLAAIDATGADPSRLKLELTESMLLENAETVIAKMAALEARGIRFSLDDFGTGFSSLSYLKRLPLAQLKIDQSFVRDVETDPNDAAIVRTVIALGQSLGIGVIAEGVETEGQRDFLAVHGCKQYQGYLFGKPVAVEDFEKAISTSRPGAM
ncbi:MAG: EAL domain-containing protein [Gammaproteobacteria bacterium]|nr:EAL domain-containing protein [Gammaproteobacteria bacterium]MBU1413998.1 EAL domain-containing protein [Gammaproteobacteria bacterium]